MIPLFDIGAIANRGIFGFGIESQHTFYFQIPVELAPHYDSWHPVMTVDIHMSWHSVWALTDDTIYRYGLGTCDSYVSVLSQPYTLIIIYVIYIKSHVRSWAYLEWILLPAFLRIAFILDTGTAGYHHYYRANIHHIFHSCTNLCFPFVFQAWPS